MINKVRIRNIDNYLFGIHNGDVFFVSKKMNEVPEDRLRFLGYSDNLSNGEQVLPRAIGPISRFNSNGSFIKLKDLPMETRYREVCVKDWHGDYHYVDVPYKRYQREEIPAPSIELKIVENQGELYLVSPKMEKVDSNAAQIKHIINLFLELFGSCEILNQSFEPTISSIPTRRVNWQILPEGEYPWKRLAQLAGNLSSTRVGKAKIQEHNVDAILKYKPSELIYGVGGFRGYLVFKFPTKNLFVMENVMYGNATYVFENDWEQFSRLTKAEIIQNSLEKSRIEHRSGWENEINRILS